MQDRAFDRRVGRRRSIPSPTRPRIIPAHPPEFPFIVQLFSWPLRSSTVVPNHPAAPKSRQWPSSSSTERLSDRLQCPNLRRGDVQLTIHDVTSGTYIHKQRRARSSLMAGAHRVSARNGFFDLDVQQLYSALPRKRVVPLPHVLVRKELGRDRKVGGKVHRMDSFSAC
jgi:hypothetical protein